MFTGLIEAVGEVAAADLVAGGRRLTLRTPLAPALVPGESVAVDGVCLTVTGHDDRTAVFDLGPETVRVTTLGPAPVGRQVNLERAMAAGARFGGHFVQGHVDGVGHLAEVRLDGDAHWLRVAYPPALRRYLVAKGSIAVNGISLTVATLAEDDLEIMIIPFTWGHTALSSVPVGEGVNLEVDVIGKYVARALDVRGEGEARS